MGTTITRNAASGLGRSAASARLGSLAPISLSPWAGVCPADGPQRHGADVDLAGLPVRFVETSSMPEYAQRFTKHCLGSTVPRPPL